MDVPFAHVDRDLVCDVYDAYAPAVFTVLLRVIQCPECASRLLTHTILKVCSGFGGRPTRDDLFRSALACACVGVGPTKRAELQARIREWYLGADREMPVSM